MTPLTFSELMAQMTQLARAGDDAPALELLTREAPRFPEHAQRLTCWRMCFAARYVLLDGDEQGWRAAFRHVPFDYEPLFDEFERQRFVEACGATGRLVVDEFKTARLRPHPFIHWRKAHCPDAPMTSRLLDEFYKVDPWGYTPLAYHVNRPPPASSVSSVDPLAPA